MAAERGNGNEARDSQPSAETRGDNHAVEATARRDTDMSPAQAGTNASENRDQDETDAANPPLPDEEAPPLPVEPIVVDTNDGWEAKFDYVVNDWYFYNHWTGKTQWENPRVPEGIPESHVTYDRTMNSVAAELPTTSGAPGTTSPPKRRWGGYNPAIHGNYDPNADYALEATKEEEEAEEAAAAAAAFPNRPAQDYSTAAHFNRFTGKFQQAELGPDMHNDENKSKRQMTAFFDVDAAANTHDGRSLKAERRGKALTKKELKAFQDKRKAKKDDKRRAWLRD